MTFQYGDTHNLPIREKSAGGEPKSDYTITRTCDNCSACFLKLAPGKTGLRGVWTDCGKWYCSIQCAVAKGWRRA